MIYLKFLLICSVAPMYAGAILSLSSIDQDTRNEVRTHLSELHIAPHAARSVVKEVVRSHLLDQFNNPTRSPRCNRHHTLIALANPHPFAEKFKAMVDEEIERKLDEVYGTSGLDPIEKIGQVFKLMSDSISTQH